MHVTDSENEKGVILRYPGGLVGAGDWRCVSVTNSLYLFWP